MTSLFHAVNPEAFYRYQVGYTTFIGALDETNARFYPFYKEPDERETEETIYNVAETIAIEDRDDVSENNRPYTEIYAEYCARRADYPGSVSNEDLFSDLIKLHACIHTRRVTHQKTNQTGVVFKVSRDELDISWDNELAPSRIYEFNDQNIRPVLPVFNAYALCEKELNY